MAPIIVIRDLTKSFKDRPAVAGLSLEVPEGSIFALLGDNGAGKTTTIRMLVGQLRPDSGSAKILNQDCWKRAVDLRHQVGYVPERPRFYDWMTVREIGWFTAGFHEPRFLERFEEQADQFRLSLGAKLKDLSKGEYAKVALALALAPDPEVLILDEPTSGLDLLVRREFLSSMVARAADGRTIFISSHQIADVERIATHVAFLSQGRLLLAAPIDELRRRIVRLRLRFEAQPPDANRLGKVLSRNGTGKQFEAVLQDPDAEALESLQKAESIFDLESTGLGLEEMYAALMKAKEPSQ